MKYLLLLLCLFSFIFCKTEATTNNGKKVILNEDGTWEYMEEEKVLDTTDFGMWKMNYYVDEYGDQTASGYISSKEYILGNFSNSATTRSELKVYFIIDKNYVAFTLYEYGSHKVKGNDSYEIKIKHNNTDTYIFPGENTGDRIKLTRELRGKGFKKEYVNVAPELIELLKSGGEFKILITEKTEYGTPSEYIFKIKDSIGFENVYNSLLKTK